MGDVTKLPRWAQEHIRELVVRAEKAERQRDAAERQAERLSGAMQEALDALWQCAAEGNATAQAARRNYEEGKPLRDGHTDY